MESPLNVNAVARVRSVACRTISASWPWAFLFIASGYMLHIAALFGLQFRKTVKSFVIYRN